MSLLWQYFDIMRPYNMFVVLGINNNFFYLEIERNEMLKNKFDSY